ncbi:MULTISPECIES: MFS transporter [Pseudomonas]|uniref:LysR family transcriptional regulator n=1 Tax=Pseudomonas fluorescens TaxID=294 RepID=A0AAE2DHA7_PSEFL|nr:MULTISPECIES: MFS transporter [Pseudomonas]KIF55588.1 LysR family transcriptional regulator [Pseudomonas fluorescens]MBP3997150.1 MHS family MFS transporter [Pseudomonas koreensis]POA34089.1 MFS transporter [Pseudomonas sp. GW456-12-1-14-TSB6]QIA04493.1 MHS family MFS transporter [Pseudomonas fluorescens]TFA84474.1 metabolite-proton symporter [Pseudomonas sp. LAIL14HWK12:I2]
MKPHASNQPRRAAAAAFIGTMIEWYDFYIYATAAALVFGALFFPSDDPLFSTMAAFGTFAVGFFARPLGGIIFGHIGDRIGRKKSLIITLLMMGVVTVCIGLLPTYAQIGATAPVLLILLRIVQGIAVGGEWGGAVLMAGEHAPKGRRNFFASFAQLGSPAGLILSLLAFSAVTRLPEEDLMSWGWRLPFLASALLLLVGLAIRLGVNESPEFLASREQASKQIKKEQAPVMEVLRTAWRPLLLCIGANTLGIAGVYFTNTFMIAYTTQQLALPRSLILECLFFVAIIQFCIQPLAAWTAEKIGATRFLCLVSLLAMVSPYPMFVLVSSAQAPLIILGIALAVVCMASFYAVIAGYVSGMFETRVRYTAISLAYQICGAVAGGLTPLIGTMLAHKFTGQWWPMAVFYSLIAGISLICVLSLARRHASARRAELARA